MVFTYTNSNNTRGEGAPMGGGHPRVGVRVAPRGAGTRRRGSPWVGVPMDGGPLGGEPLLVFTYTNSNNTRGEGAPKGAGGGSGGTHGCWVPSEGSSVARGPKGGGAVDGVHLHQQQQHPR